jgi:hypothetical protein
MAKTTAKNCVVVIGGYVFSTYATSYDFVASVDNPEVTGFSDGAHNFVPGQFTGELSMNMLWDSATGKTYDQLKGLTSSYVTLIPEGYTLGTPSLSLPYMQQNFGAAGTPAGTVGIGSIKFLTFGAPTNGLEVGQALQHGTTTTTLTGTAVSDPWYTAGDLTSCACTGTLHVWTATAADTYVVKVQHSSNGTTGWGDLLTFTANGSAVTAERQTAAANSLRRYRRVLATRTGSAGNTFGFTVHFWRDPTQTS